LVWVAGEDADRAVEAMRGHPAGVDTAVIGTVEEATAGTPPVVMKTRVGGVRPLDLLSGLDLPRIC